MYKLEVEDPKPATSNPLASCYRSAPKSFWLGMGVYMLFVAAATVTSMNANAPHWLDFVFVGLAIAAASYAIFGLRRSVKNSEGVENHVYTESTALAFWMVMLAALAWFFLETFADLPHISAIWTWVYGLVVWSVLYAVESRRMR
ncbi:hypothetical protein [Spelaeicoccus albus]|uniref:Uncharacterized protein n=2 Tax=Spelaeicoccus albus TaxID=1280376 RepID=A0A7Z0AC04_9MICO|nr:hypothetical protein [Spelaeicoccus albus]NYI66366.1 hypothetical protein [Spelaeicoccus albus]